MKYIVTILLFACSFLAQAQDEYYRTIDWKFYPDSIVMIAQDTYSMKAIPIDYNDPAAISRNVGGYVVDFIGHRYIVIDSTATTLTVWDEYSTGEAPQTDQVARCYRSVSDGEGEYIGSVDYSPLDMSARWRLNGADNELLYQMADTLSYLEPIRATTYLSADDTVLVTLKYLRDSAFKANAEETILGINDDKYVTPHTARVKDELLNVPYIGANSDVDLDTFNIKANRADLQILRLDSTYVSDSMEVKGGSYFNKFESTIETILGNDSIWQLSKSPQNKHGIVSRDSSVIAYNSGTRTLTVTPTGNSWRYYFKGFYYDIDTVISVTHPDVTSEYFLYFDENNELQFTTDVWNILTDVTIADIYYDAGLNEGIAQDERHGDDINLQAHVIFHETIGTRKISGLGASGYTVQPVSPTDADNTFALAAGVIADEDIEHTMSALADNGPYIVLYRSGATGVWTWEQNAVPFASGTYIQNNEFTGATWQLTDLANNEYVNIWVCKIGAVDALYQTIIIVDQDAHTTADEADAQTLSSQNLGTFPFEELELIYKITFRTSAAYGSTGKCRIYSVKEEVGNLISVAQSQAINSHPNLNTLLWSDAGHTGDANTLAAFDGTGLATYETNNADDWNNTVDSIPELRADINANTGKDTTGIYHANRTALNLVSGTNTGDQTLSGLGGVSGSGTDGYLPNWNGTTALENSPVYTDGTNVGIGTTTLTDKLNINGSTYFGGNITFLSDNLRTISQGADNGSFVVRSSTMDKTGASLFMSGEDRASNAGKFTIRYGGESTSSNGASSGVFEVFRNKEASIVDENVFTLNNDGTGYFKYTVSHAAATSDSQSALLSQVKSVAHDTLQVALDSINNNIRPDITSLQSSSHPALTLAGTPDYITLSGQQITRGLVDLSTDVSGSSLTSGYLPYWNGTALSNSNIRIDGVSNIFRYSATDYGRIAYGAPSQGKSLDIIYYSTGTSRALTDEGFGHGAGVQYVGEDASNNQSALLFDYGSRYTNTDATQAVYFRELTGTAGAGPSTRVKLAAGGNFLINTTTDNTVDKLQVNGTVTHSAATTDTQSALLGQFVSNETPSGLINGSNAIYTTANNYISGSTRVYVDGVRQELGLHYTETGSNQITIDSGYILQTGDRMIIDYIK